MWKKLTTPLFGPFWTFLANFDVFSIFFLFWAFLLKKHVLLTRKHFLVVFSQILIIFTDYRKKAVFKPFCEGLVWVIFNKLLAFLVFL
jgi:hypothetical protein